MPAGMPAPPLTASALPVHTVHIRYEQFSREVMLLRIHLDQTNPSPLYEQIVKQITERILTGELPPGTELPSVRKLASDLVTSVITTRRAYQELEAQGLIVTRPGIGSVVADLTPADRMGIGLAEIERQLAEVAQNAKRLGVSRDALEKLFKALLQESEDTSDGSDG